MSEAGQQRKGQGANQGAPSASNCHPPHSQFLWRGRTTTKTWLFPSSDPSSDPSPDPFRDPFGSQPSGCQPSGGQQRPSAAQFGLQSTGCRSNSVAETDGRLPELYRILSSIYPWPCRLCACGHVMSTVRGIEHSRLPASLPDLRLAHVGIVVVVVVVVVFKNTRGGLDGTLDGECIPRSEINKHLESPDNRGRVKRRNSTTARKQNKLTAEAMSVQRHTRVPSLTTSGYPTAGMRNYRT